MNGKGLNNKERILLNILILIFWSIFVAFIVCISNNFKFLWLLCAYILFYIYDGEEEN